MWSLFGVLLSLLPLTIVAFLAWDPDGHTSIWSLLTNEELLAVALTLGGASAADVLANSSGRFRAAKVTAGGLTLLATLCAVAVYVAFKGGLTHLKPDGRELADRALYGGVVLGAFFSELLAEV